MPHGPSTRCRAPGARSELLDQHRLARAARVAAGATFASRRGRQGGARQGQGALGIDHHGIGVAAAAAAAGTAVSAGPSKTAVAPIRGVAEVLALAAPTARTPRAPAATDTAV